jgi:peptide/nickel transport system substrate-binding protein
MENIKTLTRYAGVLIMGLFLLAACSQPPPVGPTPTAVVETVVGTVPGDESAESVPPTPTPMPAPERTLVVCLGQEPDSLYPYGTNMAASKSVLQAVYDGPYDNLNFEYQPVILEKIPNLADGDAVLEPVPVNPGDLIIDAEGNLAPLETGLQVRPSGCTGEDCLIEYDGATPLTMDRLVVTFSLLPELVWSDGAPLTARDSQYSYDLAAAQETPASKFKTDRTASYQALDDLRTRWTGVPGFLDPLYFSNFWTPYPQHKWGQHSPADLPTLETAARQPLGYGPYIIQEWVPGDHIRLRKNDNYFRAAEGLPRFENLVFRFVGLDTNTNLSQLLSGECDFLDRTTQLDEQVDLLQTLAEQGQIQFDVAQGMDWEHIAFGIVPASYEDGYNALVDRPDIFGEVRTRQGIVHCMDRQAVVDTALFGESAVPLSFVPAWHPAANPDTPQYEYDVERGMALLNQVGWIDHDLDPATPRLAQGVPNVPNGTLLEFEFLTTRAAQRRVAAEILTESMAQCGIGANAVFLDPGVIYDSGPEGPLFGRSFDMGQLAWRISEEPACFLYLSESIPGDPAIQDDAGDRLFPYGWGGWNLTGYRSAAYDEICLSTQSVLRGQPGYQENHAAAQALFAADLPAIPLYMHLTMAAARPDLCNFQVNSTAASDLWNLEELDYRPECFAGS